MTDRVSSLIHRFQQQQQFSASYSPLYAALFGTVAKWLNADVHDPVVKWLVQSSDGRPAFEVTNLLAAGLHREILIRVEEVDDLAAYYPTVVGESVADTPYTQSANGIDEISPRFERALRQAILARRAVLQSFIQNNNVQTNETGRGIAWLLPVWLAGWERVHLLDLGASAGLNLVADQRAYRFVDTDSSQTLLDLGYGRPVQFTIQTAGEQWETATKDGCMPHILSRTGCDLRPFRLRTIADEQTLASYIWGDQVHRLQRLREGIAALHDVNCTNVPVHLHALNLPGELPAFFKKSITISQDPLVIYNTYIKMYLPEKGLALRAYISQWAEEQQRTVLWVQWEPPKIVALETAAEPEYGWLAWTVDHWFDGRHKQYHVGWVHPHGQHLKLLPGFQQWIAAAGMPWPG